MTVLGRAFVALGIFGFGLLLTGAIWAAVTLDVLGVADPHDPPAWVTAPMALGLMAWLAAACAGIAFAVGATWRQARGQEKAT